MSDRAIVMTVCQRPFYLKPVLLDGWAQVRGVRDWPFIFMVENTPTRHAMVNIIDSFDHPDKTVIMNETRLGVLENPFQGLSRAFDKEHYEFVVLAEEDLLPSTSILEFFDVSWDVLADDLRVLAACAQGDAPVDDVTGALCPTPHELELRAAIRIWLWGTTRGNWDRFIRDTWDHDYSTGSGCDSGWDWNLADRILPALNMLCVFPRATLVDNLGKWLGAHADPALYEEQRPKGFVQHIEQAPFSMTLDKGFR